MIHLAEDAEGCCPKCSSDELDYDGHEFDFDGSIWYDFTCNDCGAKGKEWYNLSYACSEVVEEDDVSQNES